MSPVTAPSSLPALRPGCLPGGEPAAPAARQPFSLVPAPRTRLTPGGQRLRPRPGDWAAVVTSSRGAGPARGRREGRVRGAPVLVTDAPARRPPLSPREHGRVHVRRPVPVSPGWERRGARPHTASLHACLSSVDARKRAFGGECHSARVSGWHAGTPLRLRGLCASVRKRAEARVRGPDGPGREPSALSIPGSARRSA